VLLTSDQHRSIAAFLWRKAANQPPLKRQKMLRSAQLHSGLARAQDLNPSLRPKTVVTIKKAYEALGRQ
jgi:hypothetical protein